MSTAPVGDGVGFTLYQLPHLGGGGPRRPTDDVDDTYEVDIDQLTCSCEEYSKLLAAHGHRTINSLCGHIRRAIPKSPVLDDLGDLAFTITEHQYLDGRYEVASLSDGTEVIFGSSEGRPWVNIFIPKRVTRSGRKVRTGPLENYGFTLEERRWSYGTSPPGAATELRNLISKRFGAPPSKARKPKDGEVDGCVGCFMFGFAALVLLILVFLLS